MARKATNNKEDMAPGDESLVVTKEEQPTREEVEAAKKQQEEVPSMKPTDSGWTQWVIDQLHPDEKSDEYPKTDGLRRLVEDIIGPITSITTQVVESPKSGVSFEDQSATVVTHVEYLNKYFLNNGRSAPMRASAAADASTVSCPSPYNKFLTSIAETRAEGRVYRKILRLKNVVTSEEIQGGGDIPEGSEKPDASLIQSIHVVAKRCNVDVTKCFEATFVKEGGDEKLRPGIRNYNKAQVQEVLEKLNTLANQMNDEKTKNKPALKQKVEKLGKFDEDWKSYF